MRPRYAQESHTHVGLGATGAWLKALQMGTSMTAADSFGPMMENRWCEMNVNNSPARIAGSLSSGLASDALRRLESGRDAALVTPANRVHMIQFGGFGVGNNLPVFIYDSTREDVRLRWRFGTNTAWVGDAWGAVIGDDGGGAPFLRAGVNGYIDGWDGADAKYTVSGGALAQDMGWSYTGNPSFEANPFIGVGTSSGAHMGAAGDMVMVVHTDNSGTFVNNDAVIDLGMAYTAGDLVTWDLTWTLADPTVVHMKVWRQTLLTDTPESVEFDVDAAWVPFTSRMATAALVGLADSGYETTSFLYWHGLLSPRPTDDYGLFGF